MQYTKTRDVKDITGNRDEDAGFDFFVPNDWNEGKPYYLRLGEQVNIPSGIKIKLKNTQMMKMDNKSGVSLKKGTVYGATIIDAGYRGEIHINLFKVVRGKEDVRIRRRGFLGLLGFKEWAAVINPGEKIIQGIIHTISNEPAQFVSEKDYEKGPKTKRQAGAFGSTGTK